MVKIPPANAGNIRDMGSVPGSGRSPGEGNGNPLQYSFFFFPLQYSYLEFPSDRGAWWATVHGVVKSQIRLKELSLHAIYVIIKVYIPNT